MSEHMNEKAERPCGSCGATPTYEIRLHGQPVPACLRHLNHWRTPALDYTCPTACVEQNHPGREHHDWLNPPEPEQPETDDPALVERVARAICESVIRDRVLGNTHTVWTDWRPEAKAAIAAMRTPPGQGGA